MSQQKKVQVVTRSYDVSYCLSFCLGEGYGKQVKLLINIGISLNLEK